MEFWQAIDWKNIVLFFVFFGLMMLKKLKNVHPVFFFLAGGARRRAVGADIAECCALYV